MRIQGADDKACKIMPSYVALHSSLDPEGSVLGIALSGALQRVARLPHAGTGKPTAAVQQLPLACTLAK